MIYTPYSDEHEVIKMIQKYRNSEYALIRITETMVDKNIIDANGILRDLLSSWGLVDYGLLGHGGRNGALYNVLFIQNGKVEDLMLNFYRVANTRGDRRFSIYGLKERCNNREINVGDLLYISITLSSTGAPQIYIINLTHNTPSEQEIINILGMDAITYVFNEMKPLLKEIIYGGFHNNSKGVGVDAPKDVGDTLESLLGIQTNNRSGADYNGLIEIKSKGDGRTLDTLFTLRPKFEGTRVADYEPVDRSRVSAFARIYGYDSNRHPGYSSLYITIGSQEAPQNNQGFYLQVDDEKMKINLIWKEPATGKKEIAAYWLFEDLRKQLYQKHPATLWVKAEKRTVDDMVQFKYTEIEFSRTPQFTTFLSLVKAGVITYDWRGYTSKEGAYMGKNHGNAWRIKPNAKALLFGEFEKVDI